MTIRRSHGYRKHRGFTLLEFMVVMFIIVMLAGVVTVMVTDRLEEAKHAKAVADVNEIGNAIDQYHLQNGDYPTSLDDLYTKPTGQDLPNWNGPMLRNRCRMIRGNDRTITLCRDRIIRIRMISTRTAEMARKAAPELMPISRTGRLLSKRGFTMKELLVVLVIMVLLCGVAMACHQPRAALMRDCVRAR